MTRNRSHLAGLAQKARPVMGWVFIGVGLFLFLGLNHWLEAAAIRLLPAWLIDFSVSL